MPDPGWGLVWRALGRMCDGARQLREALPTISWPENGSFAEVFRALGHAGADGRGPHGTEGSGERMLRQTTVAGESDGFRICKFHVNVLGQRHPHAAEREHARRRRQSLVIRPVRAWRRGPSSHRCRPEIGALGGSCPPQSKGPTPCEVEQWASTQSQKGARRVWMMQRVSRRSMGASVVRLDWGHGREV
jgi:hypothetical protein